MIMLLIGRLSCVVEGRGESVDDMRGLMEDLLYSNWSPVTRNKQESVCGVVCSLPFTSRVTFLLYTVI